MSFPESPIVAVQRALQTANSRATLRTITVRHAAAKDGRVICNLGTARNSRKPRFVKAALLPWAAGLCGVFDTLRIHKAHIRFENAPRLTKRPIPEAGNEAVAAAIAALEATLLAEAARLGAVRPGSYFYFQYRPNIPGHYQMPPLSLTLQWLNEAGLARFANHLPIETASFLQGTERWRFGLRMLALSGRVRELTAHEQLAFSAC